MKTRLAVLALVLVLSGCGTSIPSSPSEPSAQAPAGPSTSAPAPSASPALDPDSPGPMPEGSYLMAGDAFPTVDDLRTMLLPGVFEQTVDGAADAAYTYLAYLSDSYATLDRPADTSVINAMAGETCGWCREHVTLVHSFAASNVRVTGYTFTDSSLGSFAAVEVEGGDVVVEAPIQIAATKVWNPDGTLNNSYPAEDVLFRMQLRYDDGMWHVMGIQEQPL